MYAMSKNASAISNICSVIRFYILFDSISRINLKNVAFFLFTLLKVFFERAITLGETIVYLF